MNICLVSANDVMEHFAFPGNIDFAADDQGEQRRQRRQQETEEQRNRRLEHQRHYDRCYTVENSHLLVCRFPRQYIDQSLSFSSVLRREV